MSYLSLRDWLEDVEAHREIKRITGASWDLEMSSITELMQGEGKEPKPVLLFDDIPGYPEGFRTLFGFLSSGWRIATCLGLKEDETSRMSLLKNWHNKSSSLRTIPPKFVASGPVLTNTDTGDQINLLKFPCPRYHELEKNRYFGTCHAVIQKDPDTGYVNLGTYRVMLVNKNSLALHSLAGQHGSLIMNHKYFARGNVMPVAIAIGMEPALWCMSRSPIAPWGVSEYDYTGGIKGEPVEVVEGPYTGLPLPAHAEIVVEGEIRPGDLVDEGPFGEWCGYYANMGLTPVPEPVIHVKAVHYRDNPILTCEHPAFPPHDGGALLGAVLNSDEIWRSLEAVGIPGIKGVWCHSEVAGATLFNVISIEQMYPGHSRDVGLVATQRARNGRYTIIVEEDIDPSDMKQVIWAMASRCTPDQAIQILNRCRSNSADSAIPPSEKRKYKAAPKPLHTSRAIIDACRPLEWKDEWYPIARISPELRSKILEKWSGVMKDMLQDKAK